MKTLKKEFMNELRKMKEEAQKLTDKQIGALILYVVCATLVQVGAQMIGLKIYEFYLKMIKKLYEIYGLDSEKHTFIHTVIAILLSAIIIYVSCYLCAYLFGKYVLKRTFTEE